MRAAICYELGRELVVEEVETPPTGHGQVRVRTAATAICHSDLHVINGEIDGPTPPFIGGHETAGIVDAVAGDVGTLTPGDRVIVTFLRWCGRCGACMTGAHNLCERRQPDLARLQTESGRSAVAALNMTGFAEYVIADQSQCIRVPADVPLEAACLLACGALTGLGAVLNTARVAPGESVAVIGTGGVGLGAIQGSRIASAYPVIAVDVVAAKLVAAKSFGATEGVNSAEEDPVAAVRRITSGRGVDYAVVAVGDPRAMSQAVQMVGTRGTVVIVGVLGSSVTVPVSMFDLLVSERRIVGSFMGSIRPGLDIPRFVELYRRGQLRLDEMISGYFDLDDINEAIKSARDPTSIRSLIVFDGPANRGRARADTRSVRA